MARSGNRAAGGPVTMRDVARRCGVSVMTVSLALRASPRVTAATVARVAAAAAALGYDPAHSLGAQRLRYRGRAGAGLVNRLVGLHLSLRFADGLYYTRLLRGLSAALDEAGFALLTDWAAGDEGRRPPRQLPAIFGRGEVDGVLTLSGVEHADRIISLLRAEAGFGKRPVVCLMEPYPGCSAVLVDDFAGGRAVTEHLLALGHRRLLCLHTGRYQHVQRRAGCAAAFRAAGIDPAAAMRLFRFSSERPEQSARWLLAALRGFRGCHAVFAGNDVTALATAATLRGAGLRVPEDVSVVGFDDTHVLPDARGRNRLTSVRIPLETVGRQGAELLLALVQAREPAARTITLPVELVVRGSTAAPGSRRALT